ncbi:MAG: L-Ala-D/L-Glu epimerase [Gammaproteobacteria bacterium]|nr:L-Ala-D/L-Glu epimerase [Gammaproteobacteria bacterium]
MTALHVQFESWPLRDEFRISRGVRTSAEVVVAELRDGDLVGRGECVPYARYGESVSSVTDVLLALEKEVTTGLNRDALQNRLPPGAARNALDCAFWDLEAKRAATRAWKIAGLPAPRSVTTAYTLSLDTPDNVRAQAELHAQCPLLKIKLGGEDDLARVAAVRESAPAARLIVDANEAWSAEQFRELAPAMAKLGVSMIEQPLPADDDEALAELQRPLPICADESCHDRRSLSRIRNRYDMVNIKLDKSGGLTEALLLREAAGAAGLSIMVGCMLATSLAMAPALLVAQSAQIVDLDGPLLLAADREPGLTFDGTRVSPPGPELWG